MCVWRIPAALVGMWLQLGPSDFIRMSQRSAAFSDVQLPIVQDLNSFLCTQPSLWRWVNLIRKLLQLDIFVFVFFLPDKKKWRNLHPCWSLETRTFLRVEFEDENVAAWSTTNLQSFNSLIHSANKHHYHGGCCPDYWLLNKETKLGLQPKSCLDTETTVYEWHEGEATTGNTQKNSHWY